LAAPEGGQLAVGARNQVLRELHDVDRELGVLSGSGIPPVAEISERLGPLIRRQLEGSDIASEPRLSLVIDIGNVYPKDRKRDLRIPIIVQNAERAGVARDIDLRVQTDPDSTDVVYALQPNEQPLGTLEAGQKRELSCFCNVNEKGDAAAILFRVYIRSNVRVVDELKLKVGVRHISRRGRTSPYQPGVALEEGEGFVGRQRQLKALSDALLADAAVRVPLVVGIRRVGKTSILHALRRDGRILKRYLVRYFSFEDRDDSHTTVQFLLRLAEDMRSMLIEEEGRGAADTLPFSRETFRQEPYAAFERFVQAIEARRPKKGLLLIMDEFDKLLDLVRAGRERQLKEPQPLGPASVFQPETMGALRKMIMQCRSIRVVVAGLPRLRSIGYEDRFFGMLEPVTVGGFSADEANQVIDVCKHVASPTAAARAEIHRASGGQPYLLQVICHELFTWMIHEGRDVATEQDVREVLHGRVLTQLAIFSDFMSLLDEPRLELVRVMATLHRESPWRNYVSMADIARSLESKGKSDVAALGLLMDELMMEDRPLVEHAPNDLQRYRLTIGLLGDHLLR
jgi:hypothetical protein